MTHRIYIDGDQGTTGLQIVQRLRGRTDLQLLTLPEAQRKDPRQRAEMLNACDIALLCLPDAAAREAVSWVHNPQVRILDASSAHRVHADWVYGLPELQADQAQRIAAARRVSNPGCYPTAAISLLRPLRDAGLLPAEHPVVVQACSGYSGAAVPASRPTKARKRPRSRPSRSMRCRATTSTCRKSSSTPAWRTRRCSCPAMAPMPRASC